MSNVSIMTNKQMKPSIKYTLMLVLSISLLLGLRWIWYEWTSFPEQPPLEQGVIDLRNWDFEHSRSITLNGEWEFYPGQLEGEVYGEPAFVQVPGSWAGAMPDGSAYGFGTYRLTVLIDKPLDQPYTFWFKRIDTSSRVEINGHAYPPFGQPADNKDDYTPIRFGYISNYTADDSVRSIELIIRVANYDNPLSGGLVEPIRLGSQAAIDTERWYSIGLQLVTFVIMLLHGIYAIVLYGFDRRQYAFLVFFMMLLASGISIVITHDRLLLLWLPINYTWAVKLGLMSYSALTYFMLMLTRIFSQSVADRRAFRIYSAVYGLYLLFLACVPVEPIHYWGKYYLYGIFYLLPLVWFFVLISKMVLDNRPGAGFMLFSAIGVASSVIWGMIKYSRYVVIEYYPFDIIAAIIGFSAYWFSLYFRNAAENAKLNEQLRQSDRLKDQFLAHTSHELRTPIHGIVNIAQSVAIRERQTLEGRSYKDLELLITIGRRMSHLLEDLLDLVRLKDKHVVLNERPLRLQSVAGGVIGMLAYLVEDKPVRLASNIPASFPAVMADEKRLTQILFNLVHNAIKYTAQGEIAIKAEVRQDRVIIAVTDTGAGMDGATLERVFAPYEQGRPGSSGIGLGLSICKQLVELHGSSLTARSREGTGTEFQFSLPLAKALPSDPKPSPDCQEQPGKDAPEPGHLLLDEEANGGWLDLAAASMTAPEEKQSILAVDDDSVNLKVLTSILSNGSYDITAVTSAREALGLLDAREWDLVISDVMMPEMSGYELTRAIRERYSISELPVLLLTARGQPADIYAGFSAGANDYLTKPVDALELKYRVWSLATLKRSVTERLRMEAAYLQAQIHPHFLFNTLSSILALSDIDTDKMRKLADAFTSYLRISFNFLNAGELVVLSHELKLVRSYLYIEKERFDDRLTIEWEVDPGINLMLPPLTLQPLVENAVKHGALGRSSGGTVRIRIVRREYDTLFEIHDDGKGMPQQEAESLLHALGGSGGIGIANTHRRLKQRYRRGLSIRSAPGVGTVVSFVIPD